MAAAQAVGHLRRLRMKCNHMGWDDESIDDPAVTRVISRAQRTIEEQTDREGLRGGSSTWTYLINDNPFGDVLQRLFRGLMRKVVEEHAPD